MDPTFKQNQISYYKDLKFNIKHGVKYTKLHTVCQFRPSLWLAKKSNYIADGKGEAKPISKVLFHKLMIFVFSGKILKNMRKRMNFVFVDKTNTQIKDNQISYLGIKLETVRSPILTLFMKDFFQSKPIFAGFCIQFLEEKLSSPNFD